MYFSVDVKGDKGAVTRWRFEGYPPNMLVRQGWQRDLTLKVGDKVTLTGWLARNDANLGAVRNVTLAGWPHSCGRTARGHRRTLRRARVRDSFEEHRR